MESFKIILRNDKRFKVPFGVDVDSEQDLIHYIKNLSRDKKVELQTFFIEYMRCKNILIAIDIIDNGLKRNEMCYYQSDVKQFENFMKQYNSKYQTYYYLEV